MNLVILIYLLTNEFQNCSCVLSSVVLEFVHLINEIRETENDHFLQIALWNTEHASIIICANKLIVDWQAQIPQLIGMNVNLLTELNFVHIQKFFKFLPNNKH